jgi:UDP-arabinose 4-epimerase
MKHVLVTGGAGYIGSHACKALAAAGYVPVTFDNLVYGHRSAVRWGPLVHGDVLDCVALDAAMRAWQPVAVMHFAAYIDVGESVRDPGRYYANNVAGALGVLRSMGRRGQTAWMNRILCIPSTPTGLPSSWLSACCRILMLRTACAR